VTVADSKLVDTIDLQAWGNNLSNSESSDDHKTEGAAIPASVSAEAQTPASSSPERAHSTDRMVLSIAVCALIVSVASLPPIWAGANVLTGNAVARLQAAFSSPVDDEEPKTTGTVGPKLAAAQAPGTESRAGALDRIDALQQALDAIRKSVETLDQAVERMRTSERRLALTLILQSAMRDGRPFVSELEWLRRSASDDVTAAAFDVLLPYARRGVVTIADLRDVLFQSEFSDAVRRAALSDTPYLDRVQRGVTGWIAEVGIVQKPQPFEVDAILEEARVAIARAQIAEAISAVQRLEGPPAILLAPWVARAKVRLMIDEMVQRLLQSAAGPG